MFGDAQGAEFGRWFGGLIYTLDADADVEVVLLFESLVESEYTDGPGRAARPARKRSSSSGYRLRSRLQTIFYPRKRRNRRSRGCVLSTKAPHKRPKTLVACPSVTLNESLRVSPTL